MSHNEWVERAKALTTEQGNNYKAYAVLYGELMKTYEPITTLGAKCGITIDIAGIAWKLVNSVK